MSPVALATSRLIAGTEHVPDARRARVCVVDTDARFGSFAARVLAPHCEVAVFDDGDVALAALREGRAELVFASAALPRSGGRSWLQRLRADTGTRGLPVVLTGEGDEPAGEPCAEDMLADDFCLKPLSARELVARVRAHLAHARVRRDAEARVLESEERFRHMAEHSPLLFWLSEADGRCSYLNERWYEFTGQSHAQSLGHGWLDAVHPADQAEVRREFGAIMHRQTGGRLNYRLRRHDGVYRWMLDSVRPRFIQGRFAGCVGSLIDITDEREEREVLARSRRHLEMALHAGRIGTFEWDIPSGQVLCSPELEALYGLETGAFEKSYRAWLQRIVPEDAAGFEAMLRACFEQRTEEVGYEFRILMPDGTRRWFEGKWRCAFSPNGRPRSMAGIQIDIDERKRSELNARFRNALNEALALLSDPASILRTTAAALGAHLQADECGFYSMHESGLPAACEHRWRPAWGDAAAGDGAAGFFDACFWTPAETARAGGQHVTHLDDVRLLDAEASAASLAGGVGAWAIAPFTREGRWIAALRVVSAQPRPWHATELALIETVLARVWPLVERARSEQAVAAAEAKIRESEERLRATIEAAQLGTWSFYPATGSMLCDARCRELFGLPEESEPGYASLLARVCPGDRERVDQAFRRALLPASGGAYDQEFRVAGPRDGDAPRWLRSSGRVFFESERPLRFLGTTVDITDVVQARETIAERRAELERLVAERTARLQETIAELESFSYSISHDLRAPLRAMTNFGELLAEECGDRIGPEGQDYLRRIIAASHRMDRLTQDVLVYSRVSRTELPLLPVDMQALVEGIVESYPQFHASRAEIVVRGPLPRVLGNEAALVQCVSNLLSNAVKFVAAGVRPRVEVSAELSGGRARICVQDNGIGIEEAARAKIFGIFERLHTGYEGTGIGLAVVRRAIERMGGAVSVSSGPGQGSRFCLELNPAS